MFIQTEQTPNPATLKFFPGDEVSPSGTFEIRNSGEAKNFPLAARLFRIDEVSGVFLGKDFISVTKTDSADWQTLKPIILGTIMEHLVSGQPIILETATPTDEVAAQNESSAEDNSNAEIINQIKDLLETKVRPAVAMDGGDIVYRGFEKGVVMVQLQGACQGCPSSTATLKMGIENMLRHYIPEVVEVRAV